MRVRACTCVCVGIFAAARGFACVCYACCSVSLCNYAHAVYVYVSVSCLFACLYVCSCARAAYQQEPAPSYHALRFRPLLADPCSGPALYVTMNSGRHCLPV